MNIFRVDPPGLSKPPGGDEGSLGTLTHAFQRRSDGVSNEATPMRPIRRIPMVSSQCTRPDLVLGTMKASA